MYLDFGANHLPISISRSWRTILHLTPAILILSFGCDQPSEKDLRSRGAQEKGGRERLLRSQAEQSTPKLFLQSGSGDDEDGNGSGTDEPSACAVRGYSEFGVERPICEEQSCTIPPNYFATIDPSFLAYNREHKLTSLFVLLPDSNHVPPLDQRAEFCERARDEAEHWDFSPDIDPQVISVVVLPEHSWSRKEGALRCDLQCKNCSNGGSIASFDDLTKVYFDSMYRPLFKPPICDAVGQSLDGWTISGNTPDGDFSGDFRVQNPLYPCSAIARSSSNSSPYKVGRLRFSWLGDSYGGRTMLTPYIPWYGTKYHSGEAEVIEPELRLWNGVNYRASVRIDPGTSDDKVIVNVFFKFYYHGTILPSQPTEYWSDYFRGAETSDEVSYQVRREIPSNDYQAWSDGSRELVSEGPGFPAPRAVCVENNHIWRSPEIHRIDRDARHRRELFKRDLIFGGVPGGSMGPMEVHWSAEVDKDSLLSGSTVTFDNTRETFRLPKTNRYMQKSSSHSVSGYDPTITYDCHTRNLGYPIPPPPLWPGHQSTLPIEACLPCTGDLQSWAALIEDTGTFVSPHNLPFTVEVSP